MRKVFAVLCSLLTIGVLIETIKISTSTAKDIAGQKPILIVIALSFLIPLLVLCFWLWKPGNNQNNES